MSSRTLRLDLQSPAFSAGFPIPRDYTADGANVSPPLLWTDPPDGTKSFALICEDPDAPRGTFVHWVLFNLPGDARILSDNDPLIYLRTGRQGSALEVILNTIHWYREDHAARTADHAEAPAYANKLRLDYFVLNEWDFGRDMPAEEQKKVLKSLRSDARLQQLFVSGPTAVYKVR